MLSGLIKNRTTLTGVTLICISGIKSFASLFSILRSATKCNFEKIVFVSSRFPQIHLGKLSIEKPFFTLLESIDEYNYYCIYMLHKHVHTEFALLIQYDSSVIHGNKWRKEFFDYDYIGAPWPLTHNAYKDPFGNFQRVGNGGFSLRSKKLLEVPNKIDIPWKVAENSFYENFGTSYLSEDGNIGVHNRHLFEEEGCQFAPIEVAAHFAYESSIPENIGIKPFGYHKNNPWRLRNRTRRILSKIKYRIIG
jgi:hypothetical protein